MFDLFKKRKKEVAFAVRKVQELEAIMDSEDPTTDRYKDAQASRAELIKEINGRGNSNIKESLVNGTIRFVTGVGLMITGTAIESVGFLVPTRKLSDCNIISRFTDTK